MEPWLRAQIFGAGSSTEGYGPGHESWLGRLKLKTGPNLEFSVPKVRLNSLTEWDTSFLRNKKGGADLPPEIPDKNRDQGMACPFHKVCVGVNLERSGNSTNQAGRLIDRYPYSTDQIAGRIQAIASSPSACTEHRG